MYTLIDSIDSSIEEIYTIIDYTDARNIYDLSLTEVDRIKCIEHFYTQNGSETIEVINKLTGMYQFSGIKILESYLITICSSSLPLFLKLEIALSLYIYDTESDKCYDMLKAVCELFQNDTTIATPCKIHALFLLMKSEVHKEVSNLYFCSIINTQLIECDFRYKTILSLDRQLIVPTLKLYYIHNAFMTFICTTQNQTLYRILAGQFLLVRKELHPLIDIIENVLLLFANDVELDYNLRADASDVLLQYGTVESKIIARDIIGLLGIEPRGIKTVYSNAQNVHTYDIEQKVNESIERVYIIPTMTIESIPITFEYVDKQIHDIIENKTGDYVDLPDDCKKIKISLNRIFMDRSIYSSYHCSLSTILLKVWSFIHSNSDVVMLQKRLLEELIDMSGTCSSGFVSRLVNTLSGTDGYTMSISWADQITANVIGRFNARIRNMEDIQIQEQIMIELAESSTILGARTQLLTFFRTQIPQIKEELYEEFRTFMTDTDFDLYLKNAIIQYEIGS